MPAELAGHQVVRPVPVAGDFAGGVPVRYAPALHPVTTTSVLVDR